MSDTLTRTLTSAATISPTRPITVTRAYQNLEGITVTEQVIGQVARVTTTLPSITAVFTTGMIIISNTRAAPNNPGFVESHIVKVVAVDAAGNRVESAPITIFIQHAIKEQK